MIPDCLPTHAHNQLRTLMVLPKTESGSLWCWMSVLPLSHPHVPYLDLIDRCNVSEGLTDSPQSPDELGKLQQTGVDWQSQLAFCHGQLAVFKWIVCDGYPQGSDHSTKETMTGHQCVKIDKRIRFRLVRPISQRIWLLWCWEKCVDFFVCPQDLQA